LVALVFASIMPLPIAVPAFAIATILSWFTLAAVSRIMRRSPVTAKTVTRDLAGMLVLIGCAAAMMTDGELALRSYDGLIAKDAGSVVQVVGAGHHGR
jgi:hypothetical protein